MFNIHKVVNALGRTAYRTATLQNGRQTVGVRTASSSTTTATQTAATTTTVAAKPAPNSDESKPRSKSKRTEMQAMFCNNKTPN